MSGLTDLFTSHREPRVDYGFLIVHRDVLFDPSMSIERLRAEYLRLTDEQDARDAQRAEEDEARRLTRSRIIRIARDRVKANSPRPPRPGTHCVYRYFSADGQLLYVGYTASAASRDQGHSQASPWYSRAFRRSFETFGSKEDALIAEWVAIQDEAPLYNKVSAYGQGIPRGER